MRCDGNRTRLAVVVPVYNEALRLPLLIESLRAQTATDVPVVFVNNGSTDRSAALVRACPEALAGSWTCLDERRVGKARAMATAAVYCAEELGARHLCFLDADSRCLDERWIETSARVAAEEGDALGYVFSPVSYTGLEGAPVFARAYRACETVLHRVVLAGTSFAYAGGATFPADLVRRFLRDADPVAEQGLRLSLLALWEGRSPRLNPGVVASSGRRFVVNPVNLRRWSFYDREFYRRKDINGASKIDLDAPTPTTDLDRAEVGLVFRRQALKIAARNLVCPSLFDSSGVVVDRVRAVYATDLRPLIDSIRPGLKVECLLGAGLDELLRAIDVFPETKVLAAQLEDLMLEAHRSAPSTVVDAHRLLGGAEGQAS